MVLCLWNREAEFRNVLEKGKLRGQDVELLSKIAVEDAREVRLGDVFCVLID